MCGKGVGKSWCTWQSGPSRTISVSASAFQQEEHHGQVKQEVSSRIISAVEHGIIIEFEVNGVKYINKVVILYWVIICWSKSDVYWIEQEFSRSDK